jgi:WD40 repeat protein
MRMPNYAAWASFSHDGKRIYTCGGDRHIWIWNTVNFGRERRINTGLRSLSKAALHPSQELLAAGSVDGTVGVWDLAAGKELLRIQRHQAPVYDVCFADRGRLVASTGRDGTVRLTDAVSGKRAGRLKQLGAEVHGLAASGKRADLCFGATYLRGVRVWDDNLEDLFRLDALDYYGGECPSDLAFPEHGTELWVTLMREPHLRVWDLNKPGPGPLHGVDLGSPAFQLRFSPDERLVAVGLYSEIVILLVATRTVLARWSVPNGTEQVRGPVGGLSFSPDGRLLTSTDMTGGIWVWPILTPEVTEE